MNIAPAPECWRCSRGVLRARPDDHRFVGLRSRRTVHRRRAARDHGGACSLVAARRSMPCPASVDAVYMSLFALDTQRATCSTGTTPIRLRSHPPRMAAARSPCCSRGSLACPSPRPRAGRSRATSCSRRRSSRATRRSGSATCEAGGTWSATSRRGRRGGCLRHRLRPHGSRSRPQAGLAAQACDSMTRWVSSVHLGVHRFLVELRSSRKPP